MLSSLERPPLASLVGVFRYPTVTKIVPTMLVIRFSIRLPTTKEEQMEQKYYCTYSGHQLDLKVGYCTDCMRMDCAVTADQLIDFKVGV